MKYVVVYEPTSNGWSAYAPDLPGCIAAGDTREAIELHIEALREQGQPVPQPGARTGLVEVQA